MASPPVKALSALSRSSFLFFCPRALLVPALACSGFFGPGCLAFGLFCSPFFVFELLWVPALSPFAFFFSRSFTFAGSQGLFCSPGPQVSRALVSRLFSCEVNRPRQWTEGRCPSAKQVSSVERGRRRVPSEAGVERRVKSRPSPSEAGTHPE